jgi:hypothetical protein
MGLDGVEKTERPSFAPRAPHIAGRRAAASRRTFFAATALLLAACETVGGPKLTEIVTDPPGALVRVEGGYGDCTSPCVIEFDVTRTITIAKAGFKPQRLTLQPGKGQVVIKLELAAPTTGVEEGELPKLE